MYSHVYTDIHMDNLHIILSINLSTIFFKKSKSYFYRVEGL